jgi:DNA-directed RNA polymerase subunit beta'
MPNPIFVGQNNKPGPVPVLLNLKMAQLDAIMAGKEKLDGKVGGAAIEAALKKIDVNKEVQSLRTQLPNLHDAALDRANKKLKFLLALQDAKMKPHEAYVLHALPVIPPKFRPATLTPSGDVNYAPINGHYRNIALINDQLKNFDHKTFSDDHKDPLRVQLWDSVKAMEGVGKFKPVYDQDQSGNRALKGILQTIGGDSKEGDQPKEGYFQAKLVKRRQNLSIRSTIIPEPKLGIDEVGIPRNAAMELYKPFVVAQLRKWSIDPLRAQEEMKKDTPLARKALEQAVSERPLLLKRDPALHKFSVMAFKPVLVSGKAIQIHPLVTGGFNADFDGDTMAGTVPLSREAVEEAKKMFPSKNLFSSTTGAVMYKPAQESLLGLHYLSIWGKNTKKTFASMEALKAAYDKHEVDLSDVVTVKGAKGPTTLGRLLIVDKLPGGFAQNKSILHDPKFEITGGSLGEIATTLAKSHTSQFASSIDALKDIGNTYSFKMGLSFGLKDFATMPERDKILADAHKKELEIRKTVKDPKQLDAALVKLYGDVTVHIDDVAKKTMSRTDNRLARMVYTGARGKREQLRQMIAAPMLVQDSSNRTLPTPITKNFGEGLDVGDYWNSQHGARKGTLQRTRGTAEPGGVSKNIINSTMGTLIAKQDCKTTQGVFMSLEAKDVHDRYLSAPYKLKDGTVIKAGELLTPEVITRLRNSKVDKIQVRSPMKCSLGHGICAKCFGLNENGKLHDSGTNIGILAAQALGEPATQLSMNAFHSGGVAAGAGGKSVDKLSRLKNILEMPKTLKNQATLASQSGKITDIKKDAVGGQDVFVNGVKHYVQGHLVNDKLKAGDDIKKGDTLSHGHVNPHHLMAATKDIHAVQGYLADELHKGLYEDLGVRRRNIEVVVRSLTNLTKIKDPGSSDWTHGDVVPRSVVEEHNRQLPKGQKPVLHEAILRGVKEVPASLSTDWMARLNYQQLHTTIQQAAAQGWKSDIHGQHPIPGMAMGSEFGRPQLGNKPPHHY